MGKQITALTACFVLQKKDSPSKISLNLNNKDFMTPSQRDKYVLLRHGRDPVHD